MVGCGQLWFLAGAADFISWGRFSLCPVGLAVPGSADSQVLNLSVFWVVFSLSQFLFLNHLKGVFEALPPYVCIWMVSSGPPVSRVVLRDLWCEMRTMGSVPSLPQCLDVFCRFRHTPRLTCVCACSPPTPAGTDPVRSPLKGFPVSALGISYFSFGVFHISFIEE